jgi:hypothetical protein
MYEVTIIRTNGTSDKMTVCAIDSEHALLILPTVIHKGDKLGKIEQIHYVPPDEKLKIKKRR